MRLLRLALAMPGPIVLLAASSSAATPGHGVRTTTLAHGKVSPGQGVHARGPVDVVVKKLTIAPGGSTGWHTHPGPVIAVVRKGTLTRVEPDCRAYSYRRGQALFERAGEVHKGVNRGRVPVLLAVTYLDPIGHGPVEDAPAPPCAR